MQIRESAKAIFCSIIAVLLLLFGYYSVILFQIGTFLAVGPIAALFAGCRMKTAIFSVAAVVLITGLLTLNYAVAIYILLFVVLPGVCAGVLLKRKCDALKLFSVFTIFNLVCFYSQILMMALASGQEVSAFLQQIFNSSADLMLETYRQVLGSSFAEIENVIVPALNQMKQLLFTYLPAISIIFCGTFAFLAMLICGGMLRKMQYSTNIPVFSGLRYHKTAGSVYFICLIMTLFLSSNSDMLIVFLNAYMILSFAFAVVGLSLVKHFVNKLNIGNPLKNLLFVVLLFVLLPLYRVLSFAGLMDCFWDIGKRRVIN